MTAELSLSARKLIENPGALCNMARRAALSAGEILMRYFDGEEDIDVHPKPDGTPVTNADMAAESYIIAQLQNILPGVPVVAEEAAQASAPNIEGQNFFWLVDALDGTKSFIKGEKDFTVNIALIAGHEPLLGVVYAPALGVLYYAHGPGTAMRCMIEKDQEKSIHVRRPQSSGLTAITGQVTKTNGRTDAFLEGFKIEKRVKRSSSIKMCLIAEGKADIYPRFGETGEWDTAAGDAILRGAGGWMTDVSGVPLRYGRQAQHFINSEFVAASFEWWGAEEDAVD